MISSVVLGVRTLCADTLTLASSKKNGLTEGIEVEGGVGEESLCRSCT